MIEKMIKAQTTERDAKIIHVGEIRLSQFAGFVALGENHLLGWSA